MTSLCYSFYDFSIWHIINIEMSINLILTYVVFYTQVYHFILYSYVYGHLSYFCTLSLKNQIIRQGLSTILLSRNLFLLKWYTYIAHLPCFINSLKYLQNVNFSWVLIVYNQLFPHCFLNYSAIFIFSSSDYMSYIMKQIRANHSMNQDYQYWILLQMLVQVEI